MKKCEKEHERTIQIHKSTMKQKLLPLLLFQFVRPTLLPPVAADFPEAELREKGAQPRASAPTDLPPVGGGLVAGLWMSHHQFPPQKNISRRDQTSR